MYRIAAASLLVLALIACGRAHAATLRIGAATVENDRFMVPILLTGGDNSVSALDFRLRYDPEVFQPITAVSGSAAQQHNKVVSFNVPIPGEYKVVMMGYNDLTMNSGEIVRIVMRRIGVPETGASQLTISDLTISSGSGEELPATGTSRLFRFDSVEQSETPEAGEDTQPEESETASPDEERSPESLEQHALGPEIPARGALDWPIEASPAELRTVARALEKIDGPSFLSGRSSSMSAEEYAEAAARLRAEMPSPPQYPIVGERGGGAPEVGEPESAALEASLIVGEDKAGVRMAQAGPKTVESRIDDNEAFVARPPKAAPAAAGRMPQGGTRTIAVYAVAVVALIGLLLVYLLR